MGAMHERPAVNILQMAEALVGERSAALEWFCNDRIVCLDHLTARELVARGRAEDVVLFLTRIAQSEKVSGASVQQMAGVQVRRRTG
jgi:hypothetical protein